MTHLTQSEALDLGRELAEIWYPASEFGEDVALDATLDSAARRTLRAVMPYVLAMIREPSEVQVEAARKVALEALKAAGIWNATAGLYDLEKGLSGDGGSFNLEIDNRNNLIVTYQAMIDALSLELAKRKGE